MRISDWSSDGCSSDLRMNHKRPSRPIAAAALAMTALVLAACGDDEEPTADPTTTEAETTTTEEATTTTEPELSEEEAVVKAYVEHWPAFYAYLNGTPPCDPADYFTGDRPADLPDSHSKYDARGLAVGGEPQIKPAKGEVNGGAHTKGDGARNKRV